MLLGDLAGTEDLARAIDQVEADAHAILAVGRVVAAEYEAGTAPFQDQVHVRAFVFDFLTTHATGMLDWAARTRATLDDWPRLGEAARAERAVASISTRARTLPTPSDR